MSQRALRLSAPPPRPRSLSPELPDAVEEAILNSLEKDPNRRFSTCTELAIALDCQFLTGPAPLPQILLETEIVKMGGRWKTKFYPFASRRPRTYLALAPDALWAIHRSEMMRWPLTGIHHLRVRGLRKLSFHIEGVGGKDQQWLRFRGRDECRRWHESLEALIPAQVTARGFDREGVVPAESRRPDGHESAEAALAASPRIEPVVLLNGRPGTRFQLLGMVEAKGPNRRRAESGLAIRGAMMGADAVVDLNVERLPGFLKTDHRTSGTAVRAVDDEGRLELKTRWFSGQIGQIALPMIALALLVLITGLINLVTLVFVQEYSDVSTPTLPWPRLHAGLHLAAAIILTTLTAAMIVTRWPQLVRPTALCFFATAAQTGLEIFIGLIEVSIGFSSGGLAQGDANFDVPQAAVASTMITLGVLFSLWSLSFSLFLLYLGQRAWRIQQEFRQLAAGSLRSESIPWVRRLAGVLAWVVAVASAASLLGLQVGFVYQGVVHSIPASRSRPGQAVADPWSAFANDLNRIAWQLATDPDPARRAPAAAVRHADQAASSQPAKALFLNTLGVARYRAGDFTAAIRDLERDITLHGFNARDAFFLAMAHARLGHIEQARKRYEEADQWMRLNQPSDDELMRFREEAAAVLDVMSSRSLKAQTKE